MAKKPYSVGYFSSYDRGLECLLNMWPKIKEQVPEATLDIYYGWNSFDAVHTKNPEMMKWKWQMIRKLNDLKDQGVTEYGRVDHKTLAQKMKEIQVWAYPTEFTEIHCITALKAQRAGCIPVTTKVAALAETVVSGKNVNVDDIYTNEDAQKEFVDNVVYVLNHPGEYTTRQGAIYWTDVAKVWSEALA